MDGSQLQNQVRRSRLVPPHKSALQSNGVPIIYIYIIYMYSSSLWFSKFNWPISRLNIWTSLSQVWIAKVTCTASIQELSLACADFHCELQDRASIQIGSHKVHNPNFFSFWEFSKLCWCWSPQSGCKLHVSFACELPGCASLQSLHHRECNPILLASSHWLHLIHRHQVQVVFSF